MGGRKGVKKEEGRGGEGEGEREGEVKKSGVKDM